MAFFGLTALGPDNTIQQATQTEKPTFLHLFEDDEFLSAFERVRTSNGGHITLQDIPSIFEIVYHGPPPMKDYEGLSHALSKGDEQQIDLKNIQWSDFRKCLSQNRQKTQQLPSQKAITFSSYEEYRDATRRHVRTKEGPREMLNKPLTVGQDYGWGWDVGRNFAHQLRAKKSCAETRYANELVKSGVIY